MKKTTFFVIQIYSKFTPWNIDKIIQSLIETLANRNPKFMPKNDFREKHLNYHNFFVDLNPQLKASF